jgi:hypothetical protein
MYTLRGQNLNTQFDLALALSGRRISRRMTLLALRNSRGALL